MPDPSPAATVVIPSHNRGAVLAKTLGALAEQTTSEPFEVIVALDACTDDSAAVLDKLETTFPLRWIAGEWCRASAARNAAAREARGRVIIFLDDDIVVGSGFVDGHLKGHELAEGRRVVIGYSKPVIAHEETLFSQALRRWWEEMGSSRYPEASELLVTADGGGSNGVRNRLWKVALQELADATGLKVMVSHFPPGTSKWNKIEHRLFCHVTQNWRGRPLRSLEIIVSLIGSTTTSTGLVVRAELDPKRYATGIKVSDEELAAVRIRRAKFHGEWNYTISPRN